MGYNRKHKLPLTFERYVEPIYDQHSGELKIWRVSVDIVPDGRVAGLKAGTKVTVVLSIPKRGKSQ